MRRNEHPVPRLIQPNNILLSVYDKKGLPELVQGIVRYNPEANFYSTGGTGSVVRDAIKDIGGNYISVEDFTKCPEMEGGLVKTLHPKIHSGLLAERNNPAHRLFFQRMAETTYTLGVYFDVLVGNLYPFQKITLDTKNDAEDARANIDIGGPTMMMAAAKNWHSVAVLSDPCQYAEFIEDLNSGKGINAEKRFELAKFAMCQVGQYRRLIGEYFDSLDFDDVAKTVNWEE
jgi:phosphoribosylaminoimidazolecarboxamide formyltransferase/IMP cyclohydrolase